MRKKIKILLMFILTVFIILVYKNDVKAASASISASKTSITLGESVTITTTINGASWDINLSCASFSQGYADTTDDAENGTKTYTYSFTPSSTGTYTVTLSGNVSNSDESRAPVSGQVTINVTQSSSGSSSGSSSSSGSTSSTSTSSEKSSNANLSNLGIRPNDFSGFKPGTTTYNVTVPENVESVEVYATAAHSKATISGTGTKTLQKGANALNVVVTAEDGTTKTYTINVTREGEEEQEEEEEQPTVENTEVKNGLSNITIGDLELSPSFATDTYEYTVKYIGEDTSLNIQAVATDPSYTVEILGNEELKEGENIITILVADEEGNNVATYQVTVNKSLVDEEAIAKEEEEKQKEEQRKMLIIAGGVIALILIIVIIIVIKRRRNRAYAEEFSGIPFSGINEEDDYDEDNDYNYDYKMNNKLDNYKQEDEDMKNDNASSEEINNDNSLKENNSENNFLKAQKNDEELTEKERAKREFLDGYNRQYEDDFEEERPRSSRKKGKRFK